MNFLEFRKKYLYKTDLVKNDVGFTLIELIVSVGIMTLILGMSIFNGRTFNDKLVLTSASQDLSFAIRQAQSYGSSVKETSNGSGLFTSAYGVFFSTKDATYTPNAYIFIDNNTNDTFYSGDSTCASTSECIEKVPLRNGVTISSICVFDGISSTCSSGGSLKDVSITFIRPSLDAIIKATNGSGALGVIVGTWVYSDITLKSPQNNIKHVFIYKTGQVSVQ